MRNRVGKFIVGALVVTIASLGFVGVQRSGASVAPPLTISKSFADPIIPLGGSTTLTFTITNADTVVLDNIAFTDPFPPGLVVAAPLSFSNTCGGVVLTTGGSPGSAGLSAGGPLAPGASCTLSVDVTGTSLGTKTNTTGIVTARGASGNFATAILTVIRAVGESCGTRQASGISTTPGGTATAMADNTTATAGGGQGTITLFGYPKDPVTAPAGFVPTCFFDVSLSAGNTFTSVVVNDCIPQSATTFVWFNPAANSGAGEWESVVGDPGPSESAGPPACVNVTLDGTTSPNLSQLTGTVFAAAHDVSGLPSTPPPAVIPPPLTSIGGYWLVASDGGIFNFGNAGFFGSTGAQTLNKPVVGMDVTSDGKGYWLVASDGGIFNYGDAGFFGSTGAQTLNKPIVGIASTPDGKGYWLVASDGGVFNYGDAGFFGSTGAQTLNKPIVGIASTPDGGGYWLVASDGGIFNYGDAGFFGSTGAQTLNKPVVGIASTSDGKGYWLVASDGGIFNYGDAGFFGSTGAQTLNKPVVGIASTFDGNGYWLVASDGGIFNYGDAGFFGSTGAQTLNKPVVGIAGNQ
jgi:uncharacterized repeat protein (TIGR01451 family)